MSANSLPSTAASMIAADPTSVVKTALPTVPAGASTEAIQKIAKEFEGMVLSQLLAPMFEGLSTDGPTGGGAAEAMFRPMLVEQYAQSLTNAGGVGISEAVAKELIRMQSLEAAPPSAEETPHAKPE